MLQCIFHMTCRLLYVNTGGKQMTRSSPFSKTPTKHQDFWRGTDAYHEQEYLKAEYRKALADYRVAEQEFKSVQNKVTAATNTLNEKDGYTTALVDYLDGDTDGLVTELDLRHELAAIEKGIASHLTELERIQAAQHPTIALGLQKEKAYYILEIQQGQKAISNAYEESMRAREQIAACSITNRYRNALQLEYELEKVSKKRRFLRNLVTSRKNTFDVRRPVQPVSSDEARGQRQMLHEGIDLKLSILRAEEKQLRRRQKHAAQINFLICQIEELNVRMEDIGIGDEKVQTAPLRQKFFAETTSE